MSDIFTEQTPAQTPTQENDALTTKLQAIVNEKGEPKYANVDTALDALKASQEFIPSLKNQVTEQEAEIARLREQVAKQTGVQEALERFANHQAQPEPTKETPTATLGEEDVKSLVQDLFASQAATTKAEENFNQVQSALVNQYGDKASEHIANKAKELNTTAEHLRDMARTNPTMALQLLGAPKAPKASMSYGGTNTTNFGQGEPEKLGKPTESLLAGAPKGAVEDFMTKIRNQVYREHGINQ